MKMLLRWAALAASITVSTPALAVPIHAVLYKNPQCGCCDAYAAYLEENGFEIDVKPTEDLTQISAKAGVPASLEGCHTMIVDGYAFDGLIPIEIVKKVLTEHPAISGITLPGCRPALPVWTAAGPDR